MAATRAIKLEVGPIRYVAEMIYGEGNERALEAAIRIMILLLVLVVDLLAVLMIIAASKNLKLDVDQFDAVSTDGEIWDNITIEKKS
jgi:hypothetical protein